jgi:hypothetical protein
MASGRFEPSAAIPARVDLLEMGIKKPGFSFEKPGYQAYLRVPSIPSVARLPYPFPPRNG